MLRSQSLFEGQAVREPWEEDFHDHFDGAARMI
jgi:hypothetical protein